MTRRIPLLALVLAAGATACDPLAGIELRSALRPAPARACVESALRSSEMIEDFTATSPSPYERRTEQRLYSVQLRNSNRYANVSTDAQADSVMRVTVGFHWIGSLAQEPAEARQGFVTRGTALLRELQTACAPGSSPPIECRQIDYGTSRPCSGT